MIEHMAMSIAAGETKNGLICPKCNGGRSGDGSLSITKEHGQIKWICFRAGCGYRGIKHDNPNNEAASSYTPAPRPHVCPTEGLNSGDYTVFRERYNIPSVGLKGVRKTEDGHYWVFPVRHVDGSVTGYVHKKRMAHVLGRKNDIYGARGQMHWARTGFPRFPKLLVVEDWISAARCSFRANTVALLGTHLSQEQAVLLSQHTEEVVFMLDEDAWHKSIELCNKYDILFSGGCSYITWESGLDPKDMTPEEFHSVMENIGVV